MPGDHLELQQYLERFSRLIEQGRTVLDVGCGDGLPVDAYLVAKGFAVNGIDVSERKIELARRNVPEGFFEVKDMLDLAEGEYCVDGVVSFGAMLHIPRGRYPALLNTFASFMSRGGVILVALKTAYSGRSEEDQHRATLLRDQNGVDNTDSIEHAGFSIVLHQITGPNGAKREIILARS